MELGRVTDGISPDLRKKIAAIGKGEAVLKAGAQELVNIAQRAFRDPAMRPAVWPARKSDGGEVTYDEKGRRRVSGGKVSGKPLLIDSTQLLRSIKVESVTNTLAIVSSSRQSPRGGWNIAGIHQFGAPRANIPPRPFFPFLNGQMTPAAKKKISDVMTLKANSLLGAK